MQTSAGIDILLNRYNSMKHTTAKTSTRLHRIRTKHMETIVGSICYYSDTIAESATNRCNHKMITFEHTAATLRYPITSIILQKTQHHDKEQQHLTEYLTRNAQTNDGLDIELHRYRKHTTAKTSTIHN